MVYVKGVASLYNIPLQDYPANCRKYFNFKTIKVHKKNHKVIIFQASYRKVRVSH